MIFMIARKTFVVSLCLSVLYDLLIYIIFYNNSLLKNLNYLFIYLFFIIIFVTWLIESA